MNDSLDGKGNRIVSVVHAGLWFLTGFLSAMGWIQARQGSLGLELTLAMAAAWVFALAVTVLRWRVKRAESPQAPAPVETPIEESAVPAKPEPERSPLVINILEIAGVHSIFMTLNRNRLAERGIVLASPYEVGLIWTNEQMGMDLRILVHLSLQGEVTVNGVKVDATHEGVYTGVMSAFNQLQRIPAPDPQPVQMTPLPLFAQLEANEPNETSDMEAHPHSSQSVL